jgi:tetratricopeptide (TPR) repeat protein
MTLDIRKRKTLVLIWIFNLAVGLIVLPLLIAPKSIMTWWILVAKGVAALAVIFFVGTSIHWLMANRLLKRSHEALNRGDYDLALLQLSGMKTLARHEFGAVILVLAGRPAEAEEQIGYLATHTSDPALRAKRLSLLAEALMDQGRCEEARRWFDEAARLDTGSSGALGSMAEWYLIQGDSGAALELIERANVVMAKESMNPKRRSLALAGRAAMHSLALARMGRTEEARSAIAEAERGADLQFVPAFALLHWYAGLALAALGEATEAREHFQRAAKADPRGKYGKLAAGAAGT